MGRWMGEEGIGWASGQRRIFFDGIPDLLHTFGRKPSICKLQTDPVLTLRIPDSRQALLVVSRVWIKPRGAT